MEVISLNDKEPTKKKLKQTRISFQTTGLTVKLCESSKKRKLSDTSLNDDDKVVKQVRCDSKENSSELINVISLIDDGSEDETRPPNQPDIATFFSSKQEMEIKKSSAVVKGDIKETEKSEIEISYQDEEDIKKCYVDLSNSKIDNAFETKYNDDSADDLVPMEESDEDDNETVFEDQDADSSQISNSEITDTPSDSIDTPNKQKEILTSSLELTPKSASTTSSALRLTPKQLQKKADSKKKLEEKERLRLEKLRKIQEEKEEKLKQKQEREEQKKKEREEKEEAKRKEREEKEETKKKEREEKERKRLAEIEQKNEEKKLKEGERKKKEEEKDAERRKKEQENIEKEIKKKKAAEAFAKFFVPNKTETKKSNENLNDTADLSFMPFAVKSDMRMAPQFRVQLSEQEKINLDNTLNSDIEKSGLYISELKNGKVIGKSKRTLETVRVDPDEVIIVDEFLDADCVLETAPRPEKMRVKLLQFKENRRPPYWGTWRKTSELVKSRRPLATDSKIFDYQVDSDDEWEEEEPGESLHGSDDEKDSDCDEKEDEYEIDNDFMVPHGYLSDEEALGEEDDVQTPDSPDAHKAKLKALELEFQAERNEKRDKLKPRIFGCIWADKDNNYPSTVPEPIQRYFRLRRILFNDPVILLSNDKDELVTTPSSRNIIRRQNVPEKYYPDLIRLLHGNINGKLFLYKEFKTFISSIEEDLLISRKRFDIKLKEIAEYKACPDEGPMMNKTCWYVNKDFREKYNKEVSLPNSWKYFLTPKRQSIIDVDTSRNSSITETLQNESKKGSATMDITKFIKSLSEEHRQKQMDTTIMID